MERHLIKDYRTQMRTFIMTSRFNNASWRENSAFRRRNPNMPCVYCSPKLISEQIPLEAQMMVLEMNNDTNKIMGIGMVKNHSRIKAFSVYSNHNWNRYIYAGHFRIDRSEMTEDEDVVLRAFDLMCFRGNRHMKRGQGLTAFPVDTLCRCAYNYMDLVEFVEEMFRRRMGIEKNPQEVKWKTCIM